MHYLQPYWTHSPCAVAMLPDLHSVRAVLPWGPPSLLYSGYRGMAMTPPRGLALRLKKEYSYTSTLPVGLPGLF